MIGITISYNNSNLKYHLLINLVKAIFVHRILDGYRLRQYIYKFGFY